MVNDFASVLEHMDKILDNKYLFRTIQGLEVIVKYLEEHKDKEALEKEVNKIYIKIYFIMKKSFL
jgi:hypothetical protein